MLHKFCFVQQQHKHLIIFSQAEERFCTDLWTNNVNYVFLLASFELKVQLSDFQQQ